MNSNQYDIDNGDDCCPICLDSLHGGSRDIATPTNLVQQQLSSAQTSFLLTSESPSPSTSTSTPTIGINAPCGHGLHDACYQLLDTNNHAQNMKTRCPTCKTRTKFFVHLRFTSQEDSTAIITRPTSVPSLLSSSSSSTIVGSQRESRYTAVCVPCGHCFYGNGSWQEWLDTTIQWQEQTQQLLCVSFTSQQQRYGPCPLCDIAVACVIRLYTNIPCNHPITMLNHLVKDSSLLSRSSFSSHPTVSNTVCTNNNDTAPGPVVPIVTLSDGGIIPNCILVTGAGNPVVNGMYWWNGTTTTRTTPNGSKYHINFHRYIRTGRWKNMLCQFHIFWCRLRSGDPFWFISIVTDWDNEGTVKDIDFYRASVRDKSPTVPPQDGWSTHVPSMQGYAPFPQLYYYQPQYNHPDGDHETMTTVTSQSHHEMSLIAAFFSHTIVVDGAGTTAVNGTYLYDGEWNGVPRYFRYGLWNGTLHNFFIVRLDIVIHSSHTNHSHNNHHNPHQYWYISVVPTNVSPGTDADIHCYFAIPTTTATSRMIVPPCHGWTSFIGSEGIEPPPRLTHHEYVDQNNSTLVGDSERE